MVGSNVEEIKIGDKPELRTNFTGRQPRCEATRGIDWLVAGGLILCSLAIHGMLTKKEGITALLNHLLQNLLCFVFFQEETENQGVLRNQDL